MNAEQLDLFGALMATLAPSPATDYDFGGAKEYYAYHEAHKAKRLFGKIFNMDIERFAFVCRHERSGDRLDKLLGAMLNRILIDIFDFDDAIHERHGNYEEQGKCMKDVILENYGRYGLDLIMALTNYSVKGDIHKTLNEGIRENIGDAREFIK